MAGLNEGGASTLLSAHTKKQDFVVILSPNINSKMCCSRKELQSSHKNFTFYKMGSRELNIGGNPVMDKHPIQGGVEILLVTSCYRNGDKLRLDGPLHLHTVFLLYLKRVQIFFWNQKIFIYFCHSHRVILQWSLLDGFMEKKLGDVDGGRGRGKGWSG